MTREKAMHIANEIDNGTNCGDYNYCVDLVIAIYEDFREELMETYVKGGNDWHRALKEAGKLK